MASKPERYLSIALLAFVFGGLGLIVGIPAGMILQQYIAIDITPTEYATIRLGDSRDHIQSLLQDDRYMLLGHLKRENGKAIWTNHQYQGEPQVSELSVAELASNSFLGKSGYQYPTRPTPHELFVLFDRGSSFSEGHFYAYYLLDENGTVFMIYLGGS